MVSPQRLTAEEHARVSRAIAAAESTSDGEIVAMVTDLSDPYHDVALHWAVTVLITVLALSAVFDGAIEAMTDRVFGGWGEQHSLGQSLSLVMVLAVLAFTIVLLILRSMPLRLALTPGPTKTRRVRRRAIALFKAAAERRTIGRTGILIYLSMGEHRAEIIADEAIVKVTEPDTWGEAMAALLAEVKAGSVTNGMVAAIAEVGTVLTEHFPRSSTNTNEIPDKLIEL